MFVMDIPDQPHPVVVMASKLGTAQATTKERIMGVCAPVPYLAKGEEPGIGAGGDLPNYWARDYFKLYEKRKVLLPAAKDVEVLSAPTHGRVEHNVHPNNGIEQWQYIPNPGYVGKDRIVYRVNVEGIPVKLVYYVHVTKVNLDSEESAIGDFCKQGTVWKISQGEPTPTEARSDGTTFKRYAPLAKTFSPNTCPVEQYRSDNAHIPR